MTTENFAHSRMEFCFSFFEFFWWLAIDKHTTKLNFHVIELSKKLPLTDKRYSANPPRRTFSPLHGEVLRIKIFMAAETEYDQLAMDESKSKSESMPRSSADRILKRPPKRWNNQKPSTSDPNRTTSVNRLKSKIRDIDRLLRRPEKLPADVQVTQERALAGYRQDLERIESAKRRNKMISKYHMVRFFGRLFFVFFWVFVEKKNEAFSKCFFIDKFYHVD